MDLWVTPRDFREWTGSTELCSDGYGYGSLKSPGSWPAVTCAVSLLLVERREVSAILSVPHSDVLDIGSIPAATAAGLAITAVAAVVSHLATFLTITPACVTTVHEHQVRPQSSVIHY